MSQVATCRDKRQVIPIPFAPGGCPVKLGEEKCGETQGLDIIKDFHQLYQEKMSQIDVSAGGDSLQEKVDLQQKWINDLTDQNRMLARVIEELETEAIGRLQELENKLQNAAKSFSEEDVEALAERDRKIKELEEALNSHTSTENNVENDSDRKSRENAAQGTGSDKQREETKFEFKDLDYSGGRRDEDQIKQEIKKIREQSSKDMPPGDEGIYADGRQKQGATEDSTGTDRGKAEDSSDEKRKSGGQSKYSSDDKKKNDENYAMKQNMDKMNNIINEEIATKQEIICLLKGEIFKLEDKIMESQKEASLKDDLIKELRKELKKMRNKERKITNCEEAEKELRNLIFDQGVEIEKSCKTSLGFGEVKDEKNFFEDFMQHRIAASTPIQLDINTDLPKCKDYCYLLKLLSEISTLKLNIRMRDELLVQHLHIIKVLTTKLFILENCFRKIGKTPEEIDVILSSPSFTTQDDDTSDLPLCPVRKVRPCSPETCRKASIKLKDITTSNMNKNCPDSPKQEEFTSTHSENETKEKATPTLCPVKKVPCSSETCNKNSRKSPEPTPGVRTNSTVISVTSVGRSWNSAAGKQDASRSKLGENLEKKSVHLLIENNKENMIVEPEKDHDQGSLDIIIPRIESVPVIGVQDSLEILKGTVKTQSSERSLLNEETPNSDCICETKKYVDEFMNLKEENKMFREGEEIRRLKNELDEKMKRILELNEENRTLNEMVNALKCNQVDYVGTVDELTDSEPTSSEFEYCRSISPKMGEFCTKNCINEHSKSQGINNSRKSCLSRENKDLCTNVYQRDVNKDRFTSDSTSTICKEEICPFVDVKYTSRGGTFRARGGNDTIVQTPTESSPACNDTELMDECTDYICPNKDMATDTSEKGADTSVCPEKKISKCTNVECQTECNEIIDRVESTQKKSIDTLVSVNAANSICYDPTCTQRFDMPKSPVLQKTAEEATDVYVDKEIDMRLEQASDVRIGEATGVQVEEATGVYVEETTYVRVEETTDVRIEEATGMNIEEGINVQLEEVIDVRVEEAGDVYVDEAIDVRIEEATDVRIEEATGMNIEEGINVQLEEVIDVRVEEAGDVYVDEAIDVRIEEATDVGIEEATGLQIEEASDEGAEKATEVRVEQTSQVPEEVAITEISVEAPIRKDSPLPRKCNIKTCLISDCLERHVVKISHIQKEIDQVPSEKDETTMVAPKAITDKRVASPFPKKCNRKTCLVIDCLEKRAVAISATPEQIDRVSDIPNEQEKTTEVSVIVTEASTAVEELPAEVVPTKDTSIKELTTSSQEVQISEKDFECDRDICQTCPSEGEIPTDAGSQPVAVLSDSKRQSTTATGQDSLALPVDRMSATLKEETCDAGVDVKPPVTDATTSAQVLPPGSVPVSAKQPVSTTSSAYGSDLPTEEEMKTEPLTGEPKDTSDEIPTESMKSTDKETPVSEGASVGAATPIEIQRDSGQKMPDDGGTPTEVQEQIDQKIPQDSTTPTEGQKDIEPKLPTDAVTPIAVQEQAEQKTPADAVPPCAQSEKKKPSTADKSCQEPCICLPDEVTTKDSSRDDSKPQEPPRASEYAAGEADKKPSPAPDSVVERPETSEKSSVVMGKGEEPYPVVKEEVSAIVEEKSSTGEKEEKKPKAEDTERASKISKGEDKPTSENEGAFINIGDMTQPPEYEVPQTKSSEKPPTIVEDTTATSTDEKPQAVSDQEPSIIVSEKAPTISKDEDKPTSENEGGFLAIGDMTQSPEYEVPQTKSSEKPPTIVEDITPTSTDEGALVVSDQEPSIIGSEKAPTVSKGDDIPTTMDEKPPTEASKEPSTIASEKPSVTIREVEPTPIASEKPSVTIREVEPTPVTSEKPSVTITEVEPTPIASEKPSVTIREVEPSPVTSEKPSVTITEVEPTPIASEKPSVTIKEEPTTTGVIDKPSKDISEKPSDIPSEKDHGIIIDDFLSPEKRSMPTSEPCDQSDKVIIRCICKSKYCKIVPDPNNPNQKLCVDVSETLVEAGDDDNCMCLPSCPRKDAYTQNSKPDVSKEEKEKSSGSDTPLGSNIPTNETRQTPITPKDTLVYTTKPRHEFEQHFSSYRSFHSDRGQSYNSLKKLSKEQEYAGLSRKETENWKKTTHIPPRKSASAYGIQEDATDTSDLKDVDETKNADLKIVIADLKNKLLDAEDKIEELKNIKNFGNKDNNTALIMRYSEEIDHLKKSLKWTSKEKEEYEFLKQKVKLLEQGKGDTDNITSNLQTAVDLYVDTIQLLQNSEQKLKSEVEHYRVKNDVMGDSLVYMGQEIDDLNQKFHEDLEEQIWLNFLLHIESTDIQHTNDIREQQVANAQKLQLQLMDLNYHLEMEHVNTLQDLSMLETQLYKYQSFFKLQEENRSVMKVQLKRLSKKNKCYEEIVQFFKEEMSVMSDELLTLQEVLNVTNVSSQEENTKLINAILQLRRINDRLVGHLCEIEKQVVLENQINQINEARINELQDIIGSKNNDLNQHDQTIQEMRKKLNNATKQNADLKKTIKNLTDAVVEIQEGIKSVERDHNRNKNDASVVESNVCLASGNLKDIKCCIENKNDKIVELENKLKSQEVSIVLATKELDVLKEKKADYKKLVVSLKEQLASYDKKNEEMMGDFQLVSTQLQDYVNLDHMKNYELGHYKNLVEEMKMSLMQLNQGLEKFESSNVHFYEDMSNADISCDKYGTSSRVFGELKKSMADMKRRISDAEFKGGLIEEELLKVKESHMSQIREEVTESQKELETRILASIEEQANLNMLVEQQKEEIEHLKKELRREKIESSNYKQNISKLQNENMTSNAQMEILHLKCELNKSLQRQRVLSEENDKIHSKMISLRKKLSTIEEAYEIMKQENEENKMQLKKTLREKEYIAHKNQELTKNIEDMRSSHDQLERQCRYNSDCMQNLQLELSETQTEKDNISSEAQNLAEVVKMWLKEQKVVNGEIRGKFQNYSNLICSMRESMMKRMSQEKSWVKKPMQQPFSPRHYTPSPQSERRSSSPSRNRGQERNTCDARFRSMSPWRNYDGYNRIDLIDEDAVSRKSHQMRNISYDSNPSAFSSRSPSPRSDFLQEVEENNLNLNDWFSPNFKETDTDADEGDDEMFINKLHVLTAQVQEANKRWQQKMNPNSLPTSRGKRSN